MQFNKKDTLLMDDSIIENLKFNRNKLYIRLLSLFLTIIILFSDFNYVFAQDMIFNDIGVKITKTYEDNIFTFEKNGDNFEPDTDIIIKTINEYKYSRLKEKIIEEFNNINIENISGYEIKVIENLREISSFGNIRVTVEFPKEIKSGSERSSWKILFVNYCNEIKDITNLEGTEFTFNENNRSITKISFNTDEFGKFILVEVSEREDTSKSDKQEIKDNISENLATESSGYDNYNVYDNESDQLLSETIEIINKPSQNNTINLNKLILEDSGIFNKPLIEKNNFENKRKNESQKNLTSVIANNKYNNTEDNSIDRMSSDIEYYDVAEKRKDLVFDKVKDQVNGKNKISSLENIILKYNNIEEIIPRFKMQNYYSDVSKDFSKKITDISIYRNIYGKWELTDRVYPDESIKIKLSYSIDNDFLDGARSVYYQLPKGINVDNQMEGVVLDGNVDKGKFIVYENGKVEIIFNSDSQLTRTGTFEFECKIDKNIVYNNSNINFNDSNNTKIVIGNSDNPQIYDKNIIKNGKYDSLENKVSWEIKINPNKTLRDPYLILRDIIPGNATEVYLFNDRTGNKYNYGSGIKLNTTDDYLDFIDYDKEIAGNYLLNNTGLYLSLLNRYDSFTLIYKTDYIEGQTEVTNTVWLGNEYDTKTVDIKREDKLYKGKSYDDPNPEYDLKNNRLINYWQFDVINSEYNDSYYTDKLINSSSENNSEQDIDHYTYASDLEADFKSEFGLTVLDKSLKTYKYDANNLIIKYYDRNGNKVNKNDSKTRVYSFIISIPNNILRVQSYKYRTYTDLDNINISTKIITSNNGNFKNIEMEAKNYFEYEIKNENINKSGFQLDIYGNPITDGNYDNASKRMKYRIVINPEGKRLLGDKSGGILTLRDELKDSENLEPSLDVESVKLYHYNPSNPDSNGPEINSGLYNFSLDGKSGFTLKVMDEMPCIFEYIYNLKADIAGERNIKNSINMNGIYSSSDITTLRTSKASATVTEKAITIYKIDEDNYKKNMSGTEFKLEYMDVNSKRWKEISNYIIDNKGYIIWDLGEYGRQLKEDVLYRLTETKPLKGYNPADPFYFIWASKNNKNNDIGDNLRGILWEKCNYNQQEYNNFINSIYFFNNNGGKYIIKNKYSELKIRKQWIDKKGEIINPVSKDVKIILEKYLYGKYEGSTEIVLSDENNWEYSFLNKDLNTTYKVKEVPSVSGCVVSYINNDGISSGEITVINKVDNNKVYKLPDTGGKGRISYYLTSIILLLFSGLYLFNKKRKIFN